MSIARLALLVQLGTTLPLVGLIWLVQIVAYPLFARVGAAEFSAYHQAHSRLITFVVAPLMMGELAFAIAGAIFVDGSLPRGAAWLGAALAVATWLMTMLVSVPQHDILAGGFDSRAHDRLVLTNWLRTLTWTLRGAILLWAAARAMTPQLPASTSLLGGDQPRCPGPRTVYSQPVVHKVEARQRVSQYETSSG